MFFHVRPQLRFCISVLGALFLSALLLYVQLMFYLGKTLFTLGITLRLRCVRIRHFKSVHGIRCCYHSNETSMETCVASVLKFSEARANEIKDPFRSFPQRTCAETLASQATFLADLLDGTSLCYRNVAFLWIFALATPRKGTVNSYFSS